LKPKTPMREMDIAARLVNWGMCQRGRGGGVMRTKETRSGYGGGGYVCMTAVTCRILREAANGPTGGATKQSGLDFEDAATINRAWQRIGVEQFKHKLLLRDFYVLGHSPNAICRSLDIKHWPLAHWDRALREARDTIEDAVDSGNR
jgi:hypothetical protein